MYFFVLFTVHPDMILMNNQLDAQFFMYVYFYSLHVSGSHVHINNSPDDDVHMATRNRYRIEINIHEKLRVMLVIYKDHTRMHGKQNIKK